MRIESTHIKFENDDHLFLEILSFYLSSMKIEELMVQTLEYKRDILKIQQAQGSHE